jgi:hypothetical protein
MAGAFAVNDCSAVSDEFTIVAGQATRAATV